MKKLLLTVGCSVLLAATAFCQTQTIKLTNSGLATTSGTRNAGSSFSLDTTVTFSGFTGAGLGYFLQVPNALAPYIIIASESYFTWTDPDQTGTNTTFSGTTGANVNFMTENRPLGAASTTDPNSNAFLQAQPAGTYLVSTLNFSLLSNAPGGTYTIQLTTIGGRASEISDTNFVAHNTPGAAYTLTVVAVPEPSTMAFIFGGVGILAASLVRRRRTS